MPTASRGEKRKICFGVQPFLQGNLSLKRSKPVGGRGCLSYHLITRNKARHPDAMNGAMLAVIHASIQCSYKRGSISLFPSVLRTDILYCIPHISFFQRRCWHRITRCGSPQRGTSSLSSGSTTAWDDAISTNQTVSVTMTLTVLYN